DRSQNYYGYAFDVASYIGNTISVKADVKAIGTTDPVAVNATLKLTSAGGEDYKQAGTVSATSDAFASIDGTYEIPADVTAVLLYFEAPENVSYIIDNIAITVSGEYKDPNGGSTSSEGYVDTSGYPVLKDLYSGKFLMGVACEAISHWNIQTSEIGNPAKEKLITSQFNSITFGNELKPEYNMDVKNVSGERTDTNLPFLINPAAKEMLDFAKANGLKVRAHVLVWHSQNEDSMFYVNYDKSQSLASADVVRARMTSYIDNTIKYMYENGYGDVIYAWDVVNEAVEPGKNADNLRESLYYQILGKDFLMDAFKQARTSVDKYSAQYGAGKAKLFYNDYNEFQKEKCDAIIANLTPVKNAGYIDGIGMQAHVQDGTNVTDFISALKRYEAEFGEVHITELDVITTGTGVNAEYYQGKFYYDLFKALLDVRAEGVNLTSVTIWGLTDDNSWKAESSPLIFNKNLSRKKAFDGIVAAATGGDIGEPQYVKPDYSDIRVNFDDDTLPSVFSVRGSGTLTVQSEEVFEGKYALLDSGRTATWNGASVDVSKFAGQTIGISAWVKSASPLVKISADIDGKWPNITTCDTSSGDWVQIIGEYKIPSDLKALKLYFETEDLSDIYIDALRVKVMGKDEGFEDAENYASSRGVGHMPVLTVTDTAAKSGTNSLLVTRQEQDATVSFDVSDYIGQYITASVYVKTTDAKITLGIDGDTPVPCVTTAAGSDWTKVTATFAIPAGGVSAKLYLETDGKADMYLDDFSVRYAEFSDDVEGSTNIFGTRWGGAGKLSVVDDEDGKAVVLTDNDQTYYGITFDASAYIGNEIDVQFDAKTADEMIKLSGDIDSVWPNYLSTPSAAGQYKSVGTTIRVPSEYNALKMYVETTGMEDLYLDNLLIRRIPVGPEAKVTFDLSAFGVENVTVADRIGYRIPAETFTLPEGIEITGWYKDAKCTEKFDFGTEILNGAITLYATDGTLLPVVEDPKTEDPSTENPSVGDPKTEDPSPLKEYQILDGADPKYTLGSGKNIVIRSEGPMANYKNISFSNVKVPEMALTITEGSTIIEIDSLYLDSLKAGDYDIYIEFTDGYSKTKLTIVSAGTENKTEETANKAENGKKIGIVKTGDVNDPLAHIAILVLAFGGALTISAVRKKKGME
ncbi:MAG: endo-1,4-beta-xylanase, partial [Clostridiales bacterium]|nr:endo-1,4-beta-xylanase [Clostridiales bacterium]